jgi:hypothetical protein
MNTARSAMASMVTRPVMLSIANTIWLKRRMLVFVKAGSRHWSSGRMFMGFLWCECGFGELYSTTKALFFSSFPSLLWRRYFYIESIRLWVRGS